MKKSFKPLIWLFAGLTIMFGALAVNSALTTVKPERISYLEYKELLENGQIDTVIYDNEEEYMTVILYNDETLNLTEEEREHYNYSVSQKRTVLFPDNEDFRKELLEQGVKVKNASGNYDTFFTLFDVLFPIALFGFMFYFMSKASPIAKGGVARKIVSRDIDVRFDDVIGHDEIKNDLKLLVKQLKHGADLKDISHGVLFEGGAGTGKTMLAKAIAHEAGVNFISVNSSDFVEMYVGLGARRVREVFKQAREASPCVLFFDELDAVGAKRGSQRSHRENDQTINALLTELDGFEDRGNILVIAATNRADELDEALLRSGRFDRKIKVDIPQKWETRQKLFEHYLKGKGDKTVDTENLAKQTVGFSGADIAAVCREANLIAFREDSKTISEDFLEEAIDKTVFKGSRSESEQHKEDLQYVAYHEAGHAVMTYLTGNKISRISIMGMTSGVGGAVFQADDERFFKTKEQIEAQIEIAYAGRAAEAVRYGENKVTQGASNDITQATNLLLQYATRYGFDKSIGLVDISVLTNTGILNDGLSDKISALSNEFYGRALKKLENNFELVEMLADRLLKVKTLSGNEAEAIICGRKVEM